MDSGKVLLGVLGGIAAGAIIGVLFAPHKGTVTRKKILRKGNYYADSVKDKFNEFLDDVSEKIDGVKEEDYVEGLKNKFNEFIENIADKYEEVKDDVTDFADQRNGKSKKHQKGYKVATD